MKFRFLTWAMLIGALSFGTVACDDDDDDEPKQDQGVDDGDMNGQGQENGNEAAPVSYLGKMNVEFADLTYETDSINIISSYDSLGMLVLDFKGVKFVPQMPVKLDITVPSIPCQKNGDVVTFQADTIIPTMSSKPMPKYTASNIKGEIKGDSIAFSLNFADYPTSYKGKVVK
ncbi:MAG: hypothetical protein MJZ33_00585 [Paludibacteraceae bacterium]|nr:hypothetical protein [Paludibacteraceae bacterium]